MIKKVLFTQFAIPSFDSLEYRSNVPLAAGYLFGYARDKFPDIEFVITPRIYTDVLTENAFLEYAVAQKPDLFVFTLYLWNIEKSFRVVAELKKHLPNAEFLFGGPEVNPDNDFLLNSESFSQGIVGEGELSFSKFLEETDKSKIPSLLTKNHYNNSVELRKDYKKETNPYLQSLIEVKPDSTMFFETVRGCPFGCNFCYYNKVYDTTVPAWHNQLEEIFDYAREHDFDELFLLDPTFNIQTNYNELLDRMIELNSDKKFRICTELRADYLSDEQIEKLNKLNLVEAEIGLQTTNPDALKAMGRNDRTKETIERTKNMLDAGITCKVDLIIGLPGDTLEKFKKSIDDVVDAKINNAIQVFKLSILSGTEFSKNRKELGLLSQTKPPYYLYGTPTFSAAEMREAIDYAEETLDITLYPIAGFLLSKDFTDSNVKNIAEFDSGIKAVHKILVENLDFDFSLIENETTKLCETLVIHYIVSKNIKQRNSIFESIKFLYSNYNNNNFQFILEFNEEVDIKFIKQFEAAIPLREPLYLDRDATSNLGIDLNLSSSLAIIVPSIFAQNEDYAMIKEQFEVYLNISVFNKEQTEELYHGSKLFFTGQAQKDAFAYLKTNKLLDEYTTFDSYLYERKKNNNEIRVYNANMISL